MHQKLQGMLSKEDGAKVDVSIQSCSTRAQAVSQKSSVLISVPKGLKQDSL